MELQTHGGGAGVTQGHNHVVARMSQRNQLRGELTRAQRVVAGHINPAVRGLLAAAGRNHAGGQRGKLGASFSHQHPVGAPMGWAHRRHLPAASLH